MKGIMNYNTNALTLKKEKHYAYKQRLVKINYMDINKLLL